MASEFLCFYGFDFTWSDAVITTISGANFCQETEHCDGITQRFESQQAYIATLAPGNAPNVDEMIIHPLCWSSTKIRTVCWRTLMAENVDAHPFPNAFFSAYSVFLMRSMHSIHPECAGLHFHYHDQLAHFHFSCQWS